MAYVAPAGTDLVEALGAGTLFDVARVRTPGGVVICKRLVPRVRTEPAARAAIIREATVLASAKHPALPRLVEVGADACGPFVLESLVEGVSLREVGDAWRARGKAVPGSFAAHIVVEAIAALAEIHELSTERGPIGLVHGDLGPDHVLFGPTGEIRFVDFGAARMNGMDPTLLGDDRGTLPFVAPEVARGEAFPTQAGDVYALAATLLAFGTGSPLVDATTPAAMLLEVGERGVRAEIAERFVGVGEVARMALAAAVARDPAARIVRARDLLAAVGP